MKNPFNDTAIAFHLTHEHGLSEIEVIRLHQNGVNTSFQITLKNQDKYHLRFYTTGWWSKAEINAEIDLLLLLAKHKVAISYPVKYKTNHYIQEFGGFNNVKIPSVLFTHAEGEKLENVSNIQAENFGEVIALIHKTSDSFKGPTTRIRKDIDSLIDKPMNIISRAFKHKVDELKVIQKLADAVRNCAILMLDTRQFGLCHGDISLNNVHFNNSNSTVFDFDCLNYGWRIYDLASFRWSLFYSENPNRVRIWNAFLTGYQKQRKLDIAEIQCLPEMTICREIWHLGYLGENGTIESSNWLNDAYFEHHFQVMKDIAKHEFSL